jgi:PAS domain S-box-containing protein/putative nucleotidyltransferase with HDIG domain
MLEGFALHEIICDDAGKPIDYRFVDANPAFEALTGFKRAEIIGRTVREVLPEAEKEWIERYGEIAIAKEPFQFRIHSVTLDRTYDVRAYNSGRGLFATTFIDVTDTERTTEALARNERLYRAVVEGSADGFWMMDRTGTILEVNDAMCRITGYAHDELIGANVRDLDTTESPGETTGRMASVEAEGSALFEARMRAKDGTVVPVEVNVSFQPTEGGRFFAFFRDLATRHRADYLMIARAELLDLEQSGGLDEVLRAAVDKAELLTGSSIGFFHLVDPDQEHLTLQTWSTNTLATMCTAEGKGNHYPVSEAGVWAESLRTRRPAVHNDYEHMDGKKGTPAGHAPVVRELVVPVVRAGVVLALMGVGNRTTDYTLDDVAPVQAMAYLAADIALHTKAQEEFERFFALVPDLVCIITADGSFRRMNERWETTLGYAPSEMLSHPFMEFVHPDDVEVTRAVFASEIAGSPVTGFVNRYLAKDGSYHWLEWSASPMESEGLVFAVARDITENKQAEAALRESESRFRELFENMVEGLAYCQMLYEDGEPADWMYLEVNDAFETQTGIAGAAGKRVSEVIPGVRQTDPELFERYSRVAQTGVPDRFETFVEALDLWFDLRVYSPETGYFVAVFDVITERKKAEAETVERESRLQRAQVELQRSEEKLRGKVAELAGALRMLTALSECNEALVRATNEQTLLQAICDIAVERGGYRMAWIGYAENGEGKTVHPVVHAGVEEGFLAEAHFTWDDSPLGQGPPGMAIRTGESVVFDSIEDDPRYAPWAAWAQKRGYSSVAAFPLVLPDVGTFGAIMFLTGEKTTFQQDELALLSELASDLGYGIGTLRARETAADMTGQLAESNAHLQTLLHEITVALGRVVETRDPYTSGHEGRVAVLARQIAVELGMSADDAEAAEVAGLVHDIGKLSVPAEILTKPSALSAIEFRLIREHSRSGYDILKDIEFKQPIADIVLQHHERMDGSGYPNALTGDQMLPLARVLAVADVVEAMSSHRPYRAALGLDAAIAEVSGHPELYDPAAAAACVRLYEAGALDL